MPNLEMLIDLFRESGRKITPQRRAILELLASEDTHPTAEEIYQRIAETMPDISRATVYNTLHELVALGGLNEVQDLSENRLRYDTHTDSHHHLFCTRCHALVDIHHDFEALNLTPEETAGYQILKHHVTFYGLCPECQQRENG
ncbi:MAG: transcriptional repressor [Anaerolineae bacterium]|nr:transcriptional repressor [Anaerolineae bacterium]